MPLHLPDESHLPRHNPLRRNNPVDIDAAAHRAAEHVAGRSHDLMRTRREGVIGGYGNLLTRDSVDRHDHVAG